MSREPSPSSTGLGPSGFDPERIEWRVQTARFASGKDLLLAGIRVGSAFYDGVSSREIADRYLIETRLPGLRPKQTRFATEEQAKGALERVTLAWFARTLPAIAMEAAKPDRPRSGLDPEGDSAGPKDIAQTTVPSTPGSNP